MKHPTAVTTGRRARATLRTRFRLAWHAFQARPLAYNYRLVPGSEPLGDDGMAIDCVYAPRPPREDDVRLYIGPDPNGTDDEDGAS